MANATVKLSPNSAECLNRFKEQFHNFFSSYRDGESPKMFWEAVRAYITYEDSAAGLDRGNMVCLFEDFKDFIENCEEIYNELTGEDENAD